MLAQPAPLEGEWIVVTLSNFDADIYELFLVRPDGSDLINLTNGVANDEDGEVSPDGTAIAFSSRGDFSQIWLMGVDGSDRHALTTGFGATPTWTPDGTGVVYTGLGELRLVSRDGSDDRLIATLPEGSLLRTNPDVSPDGTMVVLDIQVGADRQVYKVPLAGGELSRLTDEHGSEPEWSPDGSQILFTSFRDGFGNNAWAMSADGSDQHNLFPSEFNDFQHSWSPDGGRVVFESVRNEDIAIVVRDLASGTVDDVLAIEIGEPAVFRNPSWVKLTGISPPVTVETTTTVAGVTTTIAAPTETTAPTATTVVTTTTVPSEEKSGLDLTLVGLISALVASAVLGALLVLRLRNPAPPLPPPPAA